MLNNKNIIVAISGGIAAYKTCTLVSSLKKEGANVFVIMTKNASQFVAPLTLQTLSGNRVVIDMFAQNVDYDVKHIALSKKADLCIVAPATANILAKAAHGICDDFLSTELLSLKCPLIFAPAMNQNMLEHEATQQNIKQLEQRGAHMIFGASGMLACGDEGKGRMAEPQEILDYARSLLQQECDLKKQTIMISAGATIEDIDGVRILSNKSSGKMGIALANAALSRGAKVILLLGRASYEAQKMLKNHANLTVVPCVSTEDMLNCALQYVSQADIIIKAAAPCDYAPQDKLAHKVKEQKWTLALKKTPDIAQKLGQIKGDKLLCIFAAETQNLLENAKAKMQSKNADMVVANNVLQEGAGFDVDTNIATLIYKDVQEQIPLCTKQELAHTILHRLRLLQK